MTRLVITRHGHVEGIQPPRFRGRGELPLSEKGQREIKALATRVAAEFKPAVIYTSPLGRCVATAAAIGSQCKLQPEVTPDLLDLDYGEWQGKTHAEISELHPAILARWYATPHLVRFPMGESLQDLAARTADLLRMVIDAHPDDDVVVVSHDSVDRVLLLQLLDMPLSSYWRLEHAPCSITLVEFQSGRTRILEANDTTHLKAAV